MCATKSRGTTQGTAKWAQNLNPVQDERVCVLCSFDTFWNYYTFFGAKFPTLMCWPTALCRVDFVVKDMLKKILPFDFAMRDAYLEIQADPVSGPEVPSISQRRQCRRGIFAMEALRHGSLRCCCSGCQDIPGCTCGPHCYIIAGIGKCPMTWGYWTSPYSSHKKDHIPNDLMVGWCEKWGHLMTHVISTLIQ